MKPIYWQCENPIPGKENSFLNCKQVIDVKVGQKITFKGVVRPVASSIELCSSHGAAEFTATGFIGEISNVIRILWVNILPDVRFEDYYGTNFGCSLSRHPNKAPEAETVTGSFFQNTINDDPSIYVNGYFYPFNSLDISTNPEFKAAYSFEEFNDLITKGNIIF